MKKSIKITEHARKRMRKYDLHESMIFEALTKPDNLIEGHHGRKIAHKFMNNYVLRVIYEEENSTITVITVYPARRERYAKTV